MMDDLSVLTFLMRRSLRGSQSQSNNHMRQRCREKIVLGSMTKYGKVDEDFATNLVT